MQPAAFSLEIGLTLAIAFGALALFVWNRLRVDVVGLIVMATLIVTGLVTPQEGISGFANEATVTVAAMFVLSAGLVRTGAIDLVGRWVARLAGQSELRLLVVSLALVVPLSAIINNTPVVVVMIPMILGLTRQMNLAPSRLFMAVSFGSQMGGTLTLIGTSTNLLVAGLVLDLGVDRIRLFDITPPALVLTVVGVVYLLTVGRWLTPRREASTDLMETYELREYLTGMRVEPESPLAGRTLRDSRFGQEHGLQVVTVERGESERIDYPRGGTQIEVGDLLVVRGKIADLARAADTDHLRIAGTKPEFAIGALSSPAGVAGETSRHLAELIVPPRSSLIGGTVRSLNFRGRFGFPVLGIQRHGEALQDRLGDIRFEAGDLLLVQASDDDLQRVHTGGDITLLGPVRLPARRRRKIRLATLILVLVVLLAALELTTILVSALLGVVAMLVTRCITPDEAYREVDWMVIVLLGTLIPLGIAMQNTGTAEWIARELLRFTEPFGPYGVLGTFFLLTVLLTSVISNNAAAVVMTPVAVASAAAVGISPLPLIIAVMIAASNSFITPIGYQTNTFIYGPGGYRFSDFLRVGGPLNLLMVIAATLVIPFFFPF